MQPTPLSSSQHSSSSVLRMEIYFMANGTSGIITKTSLRFWTGVGNISPSQVTRLQQHKLQKNERKSDWTLAWPSRAQLTSVHRPRHNLLKLRRRQSRNSFIFIMKI